MDSWAALRILDLQHSEEEMRSYLCPIAAFLLLRHTAQTDIEARAIFAPEWQHIFSQEVIIEINKQKE